MIFFFFRTQKYKNKEKKNLLFSCDQEYKIIVGAQFFQTLIMFDITTARVGVIFIPQV